MDEVEARAVLGVDAAAEWPEVRAAYLRLVREQHPDRAVDTADAGRRTVRTASVTRAYAVLSSRRPSTPRPDAETPGGAGVRPGGAGPAGWGEPHAPRVAPTADWPDSRSVVLDAPFAEAFQALFEVGHLVGTVSYVDRSSGVLEVIVTPRPGEATSLLVYLESRDGYTEAVLGVEPLGRHPAADLDELVERIAGLLARPRPPAR